MTAQNEWPGLYPRPLKIVKPPQLLSDENVAPAIVLASVLGVEPRQPKSSPLRIQPRDEATQREHARVQAEAFSSAALRHTIRLTRYEIVRLLENLRSNAVPQIVRLELRVALARALTGGARWRGPEARAESDTLLRQGRMRNDVEDHARPQRGGDHHAAGR